LSQWRTTFSCGTMSAIKNRREMFISKEKFEELKRELSRLETEGRREIAERLREAKELGDLSENSEYQEARNEQAWLEQKIGRLTEVVRQAEIIKKPAEGSAVINVGAEVTVRKDGTETTYTIVGSDEANPSAGRISNESPLGKLLIGRSAGNEVVLKTPKGEMRYTIVTVK